MTTTTFDMSPESIAEVTRLRMIAFKEREGYDRPQAEERVAEHRLRGGGIWLSQSPRDTGLHRRALHGEGRRVGRRAVTAAIPPVDRAERELSSGLPETADHREINPVTGQQKGYVVLTADERGKGFVRPYRDAYRHLACGAITTMGRAIAETYARDPEFYSGTFCTTCRAHFPVGDDGEFTWYEMDGREGPKVGT